MPVEVLVWLLAAEGLDVSAPVPVPVEAPTELSSSEDGSRLIGCGPWIGRFGLVFGRF